MTRDVQHSIAFLMASLAGICTIFLLIRFASRRLKARRAKRDLLIRKEQLERYNMAAFQGTKKFER